MSRTRLLLVLVVVLALSALTAAAAFAAPPDPAATVTLTTDKAAYSGGESVVVNVTITNNTGHSVKVLKWYTPVDGVEEPLFVVSVDGAPVQYTGAVYKRPEPKDEDYIKLKAGESVSSSVDLRGVLRHDGDGQLHRALCYGLGRHVRKGERLLAPGPPRLRGPQGLRRGQRVPWPSPLSRRPHRDSTSAPQPR